MDRMYSPALARLLEEERDALLIDVRLPRYVEPGREDGVVGVASDPVDVKVVQLGGELFGILYGEEIHRLGPVDDGFGLEPMPDLLARSCEMALGFVVEQVRYFCPRAEQIEVRGGRSDVVRRWQAYVAAQTVGAVSGRGEC